MNTFDAKKLAACAIAQSDDPTRLYLNGVFLEGKIAVATDGHLMTVAHDEGAVIEEPGIYPVSKKALTAMKHKDAETVTIDGGVLSVLGQYGAVLHMEPCKPINETFPDWRRVACGKAKKDAPMVATAFATPLLKNLAETAKVFAKYGAYAMHGTCEKDPYIVAYSGESEVFSVAMSASRAVSAITEAPFWAQYDYHEPVSAPADTSTARAAD